MSLKKNIVANYLAQFYISFIGILMLPMYLRYMGDEAYGLVGFYSMLQGLFFLLDLGMSQTMARETARFSGRATDAISLRRLFHALELVFGALSLAGAGILIFLAGNIATSWLKATSLAHTDLRNAVMLMAVTVAIRWMCSLYRGVISGFEQMVWLGSFNSLVATARFILVLGIFVAIGASPGIFFSYQLAIACIELLVLVLKAYRLMPAIEGDHQVAGRGGALRGALKFSLSIAFAGSVWTLVTQADKFLLSTLLPLAEYGYFSLAVVPAGAILLFSAPVTAAVLPRLVRLNASGDEQALVKLYCDTTQFVGVVATPAAVLLACFSESLLWAWTGDHDVAAKAAPILMLYSIGNGIMVLGAFPYYLQYAKGNLKLHVLGSFGFLLILVPTLSAMTLYFGAYGAGITWVAGNAMYFLLWIPFVHARFLPKMHLSWLLEDVVPIVLPASVLGAILGQTLVWPSGRPMIVAMLALMAALLMATTTLASSRCRTILKTWLKGRRTTKALP